MLEDSLDTWYLHARVNRADTHVYWGADSVARHRGGRTTTQPFLAETITAIDVFVDLIRRSVIGTAERVVHNESFFSEGGWTTIQGELNDRHEGVDDASPYWYQLTVDGIGNGRVAFEFSLWGYKYAWRNVTLDNDVFYELADRLGARVRFAAEWAAIEDIADQLRRIVPRSAFLQPRRNDLEALLRRLRTPTPSVYDSAAADALRYFEGLLRLAVETRGWRGKRDSLPALVQVLRNNTSVSDNDLHVLRFFAKPVRDYLMHGHQPEMHMAKMALVIALQSLVRTASLLDRSESRSS